MLYCDRQRGCEWDFNSIAPLAIIKTSDTWWKLESSWRNYLAQSNWRNQQVRFVCDKPVPQILQGKYYAWIHFSIKEGWREDRKESKKRNPTGYPWGMDQRNSKFCVAYSSSTSRLYRTSMSFPRGNTLSFTQNLLLQWGYCTGSI